MSIRVLAFVAIVALACARQSTGSDNPTPERKPLVAAAPPKIGTAIGERIPAFTAPLLGADGKPAGRIDSHGTGHATVYLFVGTRCPATRAYVARIRELERTYGAKGVAFVFVYPNRDDTLEAKLAFHRQSGFRGPLVDDQGARVARLLGARRTSEILVAARDGVLLYRGAIDDSRDPAGVTKRYVAAALDEHLAGRPVAVAQTPVRA